MRSSTHTRARGGKEKKEKEEKHKITRDYRGCAQRSKFPKGSAVQFFFLFY